jgi:hypothetical protein
MKMRQLFSGLLILVLFWGCSDLVTNIGQDNDSSADDMQSGVVGMVLLGPTSPVQHSDDPNGGYVPYAASIMVETPSGEAVTSIRSGSNGRFQVELNPGTFVFVPSDATNEAGNFTTPGFPHAEPLSVTVRKDEVVKATIVYDTGIR